MINYLDYLRKKFPLYIISGLILAVIAFSSVLAYRYDKHLYDVLYDMQNMRLNKGLINKQVQDIDSIVDYFKSRYKLDISDISPERQILSTLDRIKSRLPDAQITVSSFEKKKGNLQLPLNIQLNVNSYRSLVDLIRYMDSLGIPDYKIERLHISEGQLSGLVLVLSGALSMPAS